MSVAVREVAARSTWPDEPATLPLTAQRALLADRQLALRQLGLAGSRAVLIEYDTQGHLASWAMQEDGTDPQSWQQQPIEQAFPGATALLDQVDNALDGRVGHLRLSPRRWVLAWRLDGAHAVVAQASFREGRVGLSNEVLAMLRGLCDAGIHADLVQRELVAALPGRPRLPPWPQVERRRAAPSRWMAWPSLVLVCIAALAAAWAAVVLLPQWQRQQAEQQAALERWQLLADTGFQRSLATALATGDPTQLQAVLSSFAEQGYLLKARVTNGRQQVVAEVGDRTQAAHPGGTAPEWLASARQVDLRLGSEPYGRLHYVRRHADGPPPAPQGLQWTSVLALLSAALGAVMMAARWPQRRRRARSVA